MTASPLLRAVIYDRESKGSLASIKTQNTRNRRVVDSNADYVLVDEFTDKVGASRQSTKVRKEWPDLLALLAGGGVDVVVTTEPSRMERNLELWVPFVNRCKEAGVLIHLSRGDERLDPRKISHWDRLIDAGKRAQIETDMLSERVVDGVNTAAIAGGFHGDAPYGYERIQVGFREVQSGDRMVKKPAYEQREHPDHGPIVVDILERLHRREAISVIVARLDREGIPGPQGGRWDRHTIRKMAFNVAYLGLRRHHDKVYPGTWPALAGLTEETFYGAQAVLSDPARKTTRPGRLKWLLSYLAVAPCGALMQYRAGRDGRVNRYACTDDGCTTIPAKHTDEYVTQAVIKRVSQPDARAVLVPVVDGSAHQAAEQEAAKLRERLKKAVASFSSGGIEIEDLEDIERDLKPKIEDAEKRAIPPATSLPVLELLDAAEAGKQVRPLWAGMSMPARRAVVTIVLKGVRVQHATTRFTRFTSEADRYAAVAERITFGPTETAPAAAPVPSESAAA